MNRWYLIEYWKDDFFGNISVDFMEEIKAETPGRALVWAENNKDCPENWGSDEGYMYGIKITVM